MPPTEPDGAARGRLVALEGGEGVGKSTQATLLAAHLGALLTREPGGTDAGLRLRALLLDPGSRLDPRAEALLVAADRAQHVAEVLRPALEAGRHVVTDRFSGSSLAYQGFGRGLPVDEVRHLSTWATAGLEPDLVVLLDVAPDAPRSPRRVGRPDRIESEGADFHARVAAGFHALAAADPARWAVVDGAGAVGDVADRVAAAVAEHLGPIGRPDARR